MELTFIRHGESEANRLSLWQGSSNSPLSDQGRLQAERLTSRLSGQKYDLVISSDLDRARDTAAGLGEVEVDPGWREADLGRWEGQNSEQVKGSWSGLLNALASDDSQRMGETGESPLEFRQRIDQSFQRLLERIDHKERVVVVTHGGVIGEVVARFLGRERPRTYPIVKNTALTVLRGEPDRLKLARFNDASHLPEHPSRPFHDDWSNLVAFVRHGVTEANKISRIQGQQCFGLDPEGRQQAQALAGWLGPVTRVLTSPLARARQTAHAVSNGQPLEVNSALAEMSFGRWEGRLMEQVRKQDPVLVRRIYQDEEDLVRGHNGENFAALIERMSGFLSGFSPDPSQRTVVVSHGAAIRALVAVVTKTGVEQIWRLANPENTGITHISFSGPEPRLVDFSLAPHLEEMAQLDKT